MPDAPDESDGSPSPRTRSTTSPRSAGRPPGGRTEQPVRLVRAPGFALTSRAVLDTARITVAGELTMVTAVLLDAEVARLHLPDPAGPQVRDLVVDLTDVTFLDVMGLASLRRVHEQALHQGRVRLGLPASAGPRRLLALAVDFGWVPPVFRAGSHFGLAR